MEKPIIQYNLRGVDVRFPHQAYGLQLDLMKKVIECIQNKTNALLESPTGTGKTLCLLCSVLAWRESYKAFFDYINLNSGDANATSNAMFSKLCLAVTGNTSMPAIQSLALPPVPVIYYASRTHSQLSQVIAELKRTTYAPKTSILGSREQLCLLPDVNSAKSSGMQNNLCRHKVLKKQCSFYNGYESQLPSIKKKQETSIIDMESLVQLGRKEQFCPYYASRDLVKEADVVFLPYNYIIDASNRRLQKLDLNNAIVIFDEGHNLESSCTEAASFTISTKDLDDCIPELNTVLNALKSKPVGSFSGQQANESSLTHLRDSLSKLSNLIRQTRLDTSGQAIESGSYIVQLLSNAGLSFNAHDSWCKIWEDSVQLLVQTQNTADGAPSKLRKCALSAVLTAITALFSFNDKSDAEASASRFQTGLNSAYRIHIQALANNQHIRQLSFWCFQSSVAMKSLVKEGVRSIIVASGTLSPLQSFSSELAIPFPVTLENPHVIDKSQIFVAACQAGPSNIRLNSSYANRSNPAYISELLQTVLAVCSRVPDGVLVFFPSYGIMNDTLAKWKLLPAWGALMRLKAPFSEPKSKADLPDIMRAYYHHLKYRASGRTGAVFFAVCRGKLSEGVDFSDEKGRAVLICGIPFPAAKEPRVMLKRKILDSQPRTSGQTAYVSGQLWYTQQAARAVNQALGRVIRHRNDFGAILLCDERFQSPDQVRRLPFWIRKYVQSFPNCSSMLASLEGFLKSEKHFPKVQPSPALQPHPTLTAVSSLPKSLDDYKDQDRTMYSTWLASAKDSVKENTTDTGITFTQIKKELIGSQAAPIEVKDAAKKRDNVKAADFLTRLKLALGKTNYQQFQKEIKRFKAKETSIELFLSKLWLLFSAGLEKKVALELFKDLGAFIPKHHFKYFESFVNSKASL